MEQSELEKEYYEVKQAARRFAIAVLDDENGIGLEAYSELTDLLLRTNNSDIVDCVEAGEGRYYLPEGHGLV